MTKREADQALQLYIKAMPVSMPSKLEMCMPYVFIAAVIGFVMYVA